MTHTVLITGASKGIGLAIASAVHNAGYHVFGTSRNPETSSSTGFRMLPLDITQTGSIEALVKRVVEEGKQIDVLINNAGFDFYGAAEETSHSEFIAQMDTNFNGLTVLTRCVLPIMRRQGSGRIINISSLGGLMSLPYNSAYAASKFALEGYSESLRYELLEHGIYVSLVEPGAVRTETLETSIVSPLQAHPAYASRREQMVARMKRDGANSRVTPQQIAHTVLHILRSDRPRLRYTVGLQARLLPLLKVLLPQRFYEAFMLRQFIHTTPLKIKEAQHAR